MTVTQNSMRAKPRLAVAGRIGAVLSNTGYAIAQWRAKRATRQTLRKLSDAQLADIGLIRSDIQRITR